MIRKTLFTQPYKMYGMEPLYGVYESPTLSAFFNDKGEIPKITHNSNRVSSDGSVSITLRQFEKRLVTLQRMIEVGERHGLQLDNPHTPGEFCVSQIQNSFHQNIIRTVGEGFHAGGQAYFGLGQITAEKLRKHNLNNGGPSNGISFYTPRIYSVKGGNMSTQISDNEAMTLFGLDIFTGRAASIGTFKNTGVPLKEALVRSGYVDENKKNEKSDVVKQFDYLLTALMDGWKPRLDSISVKNDSRMDIDINNVIAVIFGLKLLHKNLWHQIFQLDGAPDKIKFSLIQFVHKTGLFTNNTGKLLVFMNYAVNVIQAIGLEKGEAYIENRFNDPALMNTDIFMFPAHVLKDYLYLSTDGFPLEIPEEVPLDMVKF